MTKCRAADIEEYAKNDSKYFFVRKFFLRIQRVIHNRKHLIRYILVALNISLYRFCFSLFSYDA